MAFQQTLDGKVMPVMIRVKDQAAYVYCIDLKRHAIQHRKMLSHQTCDHIFLTPIMSVNIYF